MGNTRWVPVEDGKQEVCLGREYFVVQSSGRVLNLQHQDSDSTWPITLYSDIRLCRATPDEGIPDEVAKTMREIMQRERDSLAWHVNERQQFFAIYKRWPEGDDLLVKIWIGRLARIDNTLAWLDQQKGSEGANG